MTVYTPYKEVWSTIVSDVVYIAPSVITDPTHYYCTIKPIDPNEIGGSTGLKQVGDYLKDFIGSTYTVVSINVGGNTDRVEVSDDQFTGAGPQSGQYGYLYRSVVDGDAPYLSTAKHFFLDKTALDYTRAMELEILWREARHTKPIFNTYTGVDSLLNADVLLSSYNTANGYKSLLYLTEGDFNTAIGAHAGYNISNDTASSRLTGDSYLTLIGYNSHRESAGTLLNSTALGANAVVTKSNQIVLGDTSVTEVLTSGDYFTRGDKGFFGSYDNNPIGIKTNNTEVITVAVDGTSTFVSKIIAPTINLTTSPTAGYFWKCTNSTTGTGEWAEITSSQTYKGTINASTGVPVGSATALIDGVGTPGDYYHTSTPGTYDYGDPSGNSITLALGDDIMYSNGGVWQKIEGASYVLEIASSTILGGVKIGSGVSIDAGGVISVSTNYQAPLSGTGFVKISGTTISYDNSSYYLSSNPNSYTSNLGTVTSVGTSSAATGLTLTGGAITTSGTVTLGLTAGYTIPTTAQLFPGFGTTHVLAAYGDHTHNYEPFLNYPSIDGYVLSSTTAGVRSWVSPSAGSVTSIGTASNVTGLTLTGGTITSTGTVLLGITGGYAIPTTVQLFPGFGTNHSTAAYGDHVHNYEPYLNLPAISGYVLSSTTAGVRQWIPTSTGTVTLVGTSSGVTGLTLTGGNITTTGTVSLGITAGYAIPTTSQLFPGFGTTGSTAAYGNHTHNYEPFLNYPAANGYVLSSTTGGTRSWIPAGVGTVTAIGTSSSSSALTLTGGTIVSSGTITVGVGSGYQIPTTTQVSTWSGHDYYGYFSVSANGTAGLGYVYSGNTLAFTGGGGTTVTRSANTINISTGSSMVYPNAGIPYSTGSAWSASLAKTAGTTQYLREDFTWGTPPGTYSWTLYNQGSVLQSMPSGSSFRLYPGSGCYTSATSVGGVATITLGSLTNGIGVGGMVPSAPSSSPNYYWGTGTGGTTLGWYALPTSSGGGTTTNALSFNTSSSLNGYMYATSASFNGSAAVTIGVNATTSNTAGAIVARDGSGYAYAQEFYRSSSRTTKHDIKDYEGDAAAFLRTVAIKEYLLNVNDEKSIGFISEDTDELLSGPERRHHNFGTHLGLITKAIQEEYDEIKALKKRVEQLELKLKMLQ